MRRWTLLLLMLFLGLGLPLCGARAAPLKLRIGWVVPGGDSPFLLYGKSGLAPHEGKSYVLEGTRFQGTPTMITALAAGELDLANLAYSSFALAVENANMGDLRVLSDVFQDGAPGYFTNADVVLKDSPIKTVEDLKGKVAASNVEGSAVDMALRAMLIQHHLNPRQDVTIVEVAFPNMRSELQEKKIDLMTAVSPFIYDPQLMNIDRVLFTQKQAIGRSQMLVLVGRAPFIAAHRAAIVDYLEDELRAQRWYTDPANHDATVKFVAAFAKRPPALYADWLFTHKDFYRDPNGMPDLTALQANITLQQKLGYLAKPLDVKNYSDLSLMQEAATRLK